MLKLEEFAKNFNGLEVPDELVRLLKFQNEVSKNGAYSDGFWLTVDAQKVGLKTYSEDEVFLSSLIDFANADGTGSTYGLWVKDKDISLGKSPIVAFGSEGGFHIVAENIGDLLQILTFDSEPMIDWDTVSFYKNTENYNPSDYSEVYKKWLKDTFGLDPIENPDLIVKEAQDKYQEELYKWFRKYCEWE